MGPQKLGRDFKTIKVQCIEGHEIARYRKPKPEWGHRTHKLWLIEERLGRLSTGPPILIDSPETQQIEVVTPPLGTSVECGASECTLEIGVISMIKGTVALELNQSNLKPTKG